MNFRLRDLPSEFHGIMARVFVSYRITDSLEAERLGDEIRSRGHDVWLDSDAGGTAPWMNREWMSTLARQLAGARVRLLPVRLTGGRHDLVVDWEKKGVDALCSSLE